MERYSSYRDSGTEWLAGIPTHWADVNPKALFTQRKDRAFIGDRQLTASQQYGIMYQDEYMELTGTKVVTVDKDFDILKHVEAGDFVISMRSFQGGLEYSEIEGCISSAYVMLIPNLEYVYPPFYRWLLKSDGYINALRSTSNLVRDGQAMRYSNFAQVRLICPPMNEQVVIADYLSQKITHIDSLIAEAKASIEEYKQWKASIIYEAVTKGLDQNVEMKDSGVEWIGEIPQAWEIKLLSQLAFRVKNNNTGMQENNLLSLSYGKIKRKSINSTDGLLPESFDGYNIINAGDIVLRLTDLQNDHTSLRVGRAEERGIITSAYVTVRPLEENISEYLYYALHSFDVKKGFYGMGSGVRQGLNYSEVKTLKLPFPDARTQHSIVKFIKAKVAKIDSLISEKESLVADLESYKKSLIYEAVTGKRRVCR